MKTYKYKAKNLKGKIVKGEVESEDEETLKHELRKKGYYLIKNKINKEKNFSILTNKLKSKELSILCNQFSIIISSGINISQAIEILKRQMKNRAVKNAFEKVKKQIDTGETLADSFISEKVMFPSIMINMITIGEESGSLEEVFKDLAVYFQREYLFSKDLWSALTYPILLCVVTVLVILVLLIKVIPSFSTILLSLKQNLPPLTKLILSISKLLKANYLSIMILSALIIIAIKKVETTEKGKFYKYKFLIEAPIIKKIYLKGIQLKIIRCMNIVLKSGETAFKAIQLSILCIDNVLIKNKLMMCTEEIMQGDSMLKTIEGTLIFDEMVLAMISIGEETGKLPEMLAKSSEIIDEDVKTLMKTSVKFIEPVMIVSLSMVVGLIIYAVLLPMMSVMDNV